MELLVLEKSPCLSVVHITNTMTTITPKKTAIATKSQLEVRPSESDEELIEVVEEDEVEPNAFKYFP